MSAIVKAAHGLVAGQRVVFSNLVGGVGIDPDFPYYVVPVVNVNDFQIAETDGGTPITFTTVTSASMQVVPETETTDTYGTGTYAAITDPADAQAPPTTPPTPSAPTVASATVAGVVRLQITLNDTAEAKVRAWEVQVTSKFDSFGAPDWTTPTKITLPEGSTTVSLPALGSTLYNARVSATDVYGQLSPFSTATAHTTLAGADALAAALASLANDVSDGIITETKIADGAISTPKLQAGSVTAQVLAATIVLASLIKTAQSGRRIEIDVDGIRLYDTDESLLVRIPTNGDPVYVKGKVDADQLTSQTAASFRTAASLEGNAVMTLQNGVSNPATGPSLTASVDSLALTGTALPSSALGIAYDSVAGTFWVATDPASGYVAYEYNASTGAFVRRIAATGSTSTVTGTVGSTSHVSDGANGRDGSTDSHVSTPLTMPSPAGATNMKVTKVAAYFAGHNGSCTARVGIWSTSNNNLGTSAQFTAASGGATGTGNSDLHNVALSSAVAVTPGSTYRFGWYHDNTGDGHQWDFDSGSSKTTYSGDGTTADGTGWGTLSSSAKPNVSATYTYDVDTRKETAPMIGVAVDPVGGFVYTLDTLGQVWKYNRTTLAWVANSAVQTAITGTKSKAGLFWDATAGELIITTTTGTGAGVFPKFVRVATTLAVSSTVYSAAAGTTFNGATDTFRGGARLADPLNASAATYWIATTSAVYAYTFTGTTATQTANRDFGQATTVGDGLTHDGTQFRGFDSASLSKVWKFSAWDWTTASAIYWFCYAWYDSNATGGLHETGVSPRTSITMRRRERVQVQQPSIPTGGTDDPDKVRVYALPNATDPGTGAVYQLQNGTDALTSRYVITYNGAGGANLAASNFPSGVPADLTDAGGNWHLKGDGTASFKDISASGVATLAETNNVIKGLKGVINTTFTIAGGGTATFGSKSLVWSRLGNWVFFRLTFTITAVGSGATGVTVTGTALPQVATGGTPNVTGDRGGTGTVPLFFRMTNSGGEAIVSRILAYPVNAAITGADLVSGAAYTAVGVYYTSDAYAAP